MPEKLEQKVSSTNKNKLQYLLKLANRNDNSINHFEIIATKKDTVSKRLIISKNKNIKINHNDFEKLNNIVDKDLSTEIKIIGELVRDNKLKELSVKIIKIDKLLNFDLEIRGIINS